MNPVQSNLSLTEEERTAPQEIFNNQGILIASKLKICILSQCNFNSVYGRTERVKVLANDDLLKQLKLNEKVKKDSRKNGKEIFLCIGHLKHEKLQTSSIVKYIQDSKVIPENLQLKSKNARTFLPSLYWRKNDFAKLKSTTNV
jgi:hypothetical protein